MIVAREFYGALAVLLVGLPLYAQEMLTDRPDQTETATVVPMGSVQVESGGAVEFDGPAEQRNRTTAFSSLVRVGLLPTFELRLNGAVLHHQTGATAASGIGDVAVGAKIAIAREFGDLPEMALVAEMTLPVGGDEVRPHELLPLLRMAFSRSLGESSSLGLNLGAEWGEGDEPAQGFYTLSLGSELAEQIGGYVELFGSLGAASPPAHSADGGFTWLLADRLQLDLSAGVGLSPAAPDYFVSAGVSFRIPY